MIDWRGALGYDSLRAVNLVLAMRRLLMNARSNLKRVAVWGLTVLALLARTGAAEMKDFPCGQQLKSFQRTLSRSVGMSYLLYLPKGYDADAGHPVPSRRS